MEIPGKKFISKIISKLAKEKTGCNPDISLRGADISKHGDDYTMDVRFVAKASKKEVKKILKSLNSNKKSKK